MDASLKSFNSFQEILILGSSIGMGLDIFCDFFFPAKTQLLDARGPATCNQISYYPLIRKAFFERNCPVVVKLTNIT